MSFYQQFRSRTAIELGVNETIFSNTFEKWFWFALSWT